MIASLDPANGPVPWNDDSLARTMRLDLEDEERRALLGSHAISTALGVAFLLLQQFGPRSEQGSAVEADRPPVIVVGDLTAMKPPTIIEPMFNASRGRSAAVARGRTKASADAARGAMAAKDIGSAFDSPGGSRGGGLVGDAPGLLRGVAVSGGTGDAGAGADAKRVLGYGEGGVASTLPGGAGLSAGSGGGSSIGGVRGSGGVGRATVDVSGPEAVPVSLPAAGGGAAAALGTFVRGRESELRFCYQESLEANPQLAGAVTVAITVSATGSISNAAVTRRTWTGNAAADAEACMLRAIRGWRFSGSERSAGTYAFPFSFTR